MYTIREAFQKERTIELRLAVNYIVQEPPKIQVLKEGRLGWKEKKFGRDAREIDILNFSIRRIRTNLFHGGKFNDAFEKDVSRNNLHLEYSMIILNEWLELNSRVKESFSTHIE